MISNLPKGHYGKKKSLCSAPFHTKGSKKSLRPISEAQSKQIFEKLNGVLLPIGTNICDNCRKNGSNKAFLAKAATTLER